MKRLFSHWMRPLVFAACSLLLGTSQKVVAQQEALYTQYLFNQLAINPAYAGSRDGFALTAVYRNQWTGISGSPQTISLAMHSPVGKRIGLGLQIVNDRLGIVQETGAWGNFAFRLPAGKGTLALGLSGGVSLFQTDVDGGFIVDPDDPVFAASQQLWLPNVGGGIYYYTTGFYLGIAAPRLIDNALRETSAAVSGAQTASQARHANLMSGFVFRLGDGVKLRPAALLRYQANQPVQSEFSLDGLFLDRFWLGAGYRSGGSMDAHLVLHVNEVLRLGYAYDWVVNEIGSQTGGSHEVLLGIDLGDRRQPVSSPRQFVPRYF